ncbi:hypothetical protein [Actinokineospora auranticolor]|uniref:hypothetical protein n=1 Tax=Actinokineospora auranticolor TaxID=155976 RepID=UPI000CEBC751
MDGLAEVGADLEGGHRVRVDGDPAHVLRFGDVALGDVELVLVQHRGPVAVDLEAVRVVRDQLLRTVDGPRADEQVGALGESDPVAVELEGVDRVRAHGQPARAEVARLDLQRAVGGPDRDAVTGELWTVWRRSC